MDVATKRQRENRRFFPGGRVPGPVLLAHAFSTGTAELTAPHGRFDLIDVMRGAALCGMVVYHFGFDLAFFGFVPADMATTGGWKLFAHVIAGTFLGLVGVSLVLAHRGGLRVRPFVRRLMVVTVAAGVVTTATLIVLPDQFIFFGILHNIALSSMLALPFLWLPAWLVGLAGAAAVALPHYVSLPVFDTPWFHWIGLGTFRPPTNDYVPVFPWFGVVLLGLAVAKVVSFAPESAWTRWRAGSTPSRLVVWAGRHSLPIYLIHQPVLIGALYVVIQLGVTPGLGRETGFLQSCEATCRDSGAGPELWRAACACTVEELKAEGLWRRR